MLPLPGSPAICTGTAANGVAYGTTNGQRGGTHSTAYCTSSQLDAGSVQTSYGQASFVQQPTSTGVNQVITPSPAIEVPEGGGYALGVPVTLAISTGNGTLQGTTTVTTAMTSGNNAATFSGISVNAAGVNDVLQATFGINQPLGALYNTLSNSFDIGYVPTVTQLSAHSGPATGGTAVTITGTNLDKVTSVMFGPNAGTVNAHSGSTSLSVTSPAETTASTVDVTVTGSGGTSSTSAADQFTYVTQDPSAQTSTVVAAPAVQDVGATSTFTFTIEDANGMPVGSGPGFNTIINADFTSTSSSPTAQATITTPSGVLTTSPNIPVHGTFMVNSQGVAVVTVTAPAPMTVSMINVKVTGYSGYVAYLPSRSLTFAQPSYQVTTLSDASMGVATNCADLTSNPAGANTNCSLRDAVAAANAQNASTISNSSFAPALTATATTAAPAVLTLAHGDFVVTGSINLVGPGANLLTIDAHNASRIFSFSNVVTEAVSGLTLTRGNGVGTGGTSSGGAIYSRANLTLSSLAATSNTTAIGGFLSANNGSVTILQSTFSGNNSNFEGGAVDVSGIALSVVGSTFYGNSTTGTGGAIDSNSAISLAGSTVTGNTASGGGGISASSVTATNSIISNNMAGVQSNVGGSLTGTGNYADNTSNSTLNAKLSPLGYYGGSTQTMLPLPGSPVICAGLQGNIPSGVTTDQRGSADTQVYGGVSCVDSGAVQTHYALAFQQQPTNVITGVAMSPAPTVLLSESGIPFTVAPETVTLNGAGIASGNSVNTFATTGVASYGLLVFNAAEVNDTLTASLPLNSAITPAIAATSAASSMFNVTAQTFSAQNSTLVASPTTVDVGSTYTVKATVLDTNGQPIQDARVTIKVHGNVTASTGSDGVVTLSGFFQSMPGTVQISGTVSVNGGAAVSFAQTPVVTFVEPSYLVTTLIDDATGVPGNCPDLGVNPGATGGGNCSLRDAVAAANAQRPSAISAITFSPALAGTVANPATITLSGTQISLTGNATIAGPGANLLTVSGNNASGVLSTTGNDTFSGLTIANGTNASGGGDISSPSGNLTLNQVAITGGQANAGYGGGLNFVGQTLTLLGCTFSQNAAANGGALYFNGTADSIIDTTFSNNTTTGAGGAIYADASLSLTATTITQNTAPGFGGGIILNPNASLTLNNSIVSGNSAASGDITGAYTGSGNVVGTAASLAPLGSYGGPTQTMLPLPGSPAICAGVAANIPNGTTTDQRGAANNTAYGSSTCVDAGAVQTHYAIAFSQQPSNTAQNAAMSPAPVVTLTENGLAFTAAGETIVLTQSGTGTVSGNSATTSTTSGTATYAALTFNTAQTNDTLTAPLTLNAATGTSVSAVSAIFNVSPASAQLGFGTAPAATVVAGGNAGSAITVKEENANGNTVVASDTITLKVSGPNGYAQTYTASAASGVATFNLSSAALTAAGSYNYTASYGSLTAATATESVSAAAANKVTIVSGSGQSAPYNTAFGAPLKVSVTDQYGNTVGAGTNVTFTPPASGASAALSPATAQTLGDGTATSSATANNMAGTYSVSATVNGGTAASFTLTNNQAATSLTVTPASATYGAATTTLQATLSGIVGSTSAGVTFQVDSGAIVTASCSAGPSPITCTASYPTGTLTAGSHTITASYGGDANYGASTGGGSLVMNSTAPAISFTIPNHTYGDAPFTVQATSNSTGSFTYKLISGSATVSGNTVTITGVGTVTIEADEASDANYTAGAKQASFTVAQAALMITANNATRYYGAANPAFTGTVTGTKNNDTLTESFTTQATATSAPGPYTIVPAVTGANGADYNVTATNGTLTVTQAPTTTSITTGAATVNPNQNAMLYASVASTTTGTPTGSVTFYDSGNALATVALINGSASYSATLAPGVSHVLTAIYGGDKNYLGSSSTNSSTVSVGALDFTFTDIASPAATVAPGHKVTFSFGLSPNFGSYAGPVTFSLTGLPPGAVASFTPSSVAANGGAQMVVLSITAPAPIAGNRMPSSPFNRQAPLFALLLLPAFGSRRFRRAFRARLLLTVVMVGCLGLAATLTGCGTGTGFELQQPAIYTVTVTASSGALVHTQTVTLTIQ